MVSKKEVMEYLQANKDSLGMDILLNDAIPKDDLIGITAYLSEVEVNEEFNDITPKKIKAIDKFLKVFNDKKGRYGIQIFTDYNNKMNFKNLNDYMKFRTLLSIFDGKIRAILTAMSGSKITLEKDVEFNAF